MADDTKRASEVDTILQCSEAAEPPDTEIDTSGPEARLGSAVHDSLQAWVDAGCESEPDPQPWANQHGVDVAAVDELISKAPDAVKAIREDLSTLQAEVKIEGGGIRGRIDGLALLMGGDTLFAASVLDWKTGRDPWANTKPMQRLAYASAVEAVHGMPAMGYIHTAEIWLATGDIIETRFDIDSIAGFRARLADALKYKRFSPGDACKYCRRRYDCPGRDQWIRAGATALVEFGPDKITPEQVAALWDQSRLVKKALEHYETIVDALVDEHGGLALPDGRRIEHGTKTLEKIEPRKAWPVMRQAGLTNDDINDIVTVGKTKLLNLIGARAARGKKGEAKAAMSAKLDEAGAISRTKSKYRKIIKK